MRKSLGHLLNRELSRGWTACGEMAVAERAEFLQKLHKGLGHMMNRKLASGFAGWLSGALWQCGDEQRASPHAQSRAVSRLGCFVAYYASVLAKRESMRKSLSHLLNRELSRGWTAWHEMAVERAAFMQKLRHGLGT